MASYKYEQARSRKDDTTSYDFKKRLEDDDGVGDFWSDVKEDEVQEKIKARTNIVERMRLCVLPVIDFYRPLPSNRNTTNSGSVPDLDIDLDFTTTSNAEREIKNLYSQLRLGSSLLCAISLFFWCWALHNTRAMKGGQDLGIYSFFTTFLSSHYLLCRTRWGPTSGTSVATTFTRLVVTGSHVLVFLNYCLGILYAFTVGSHIYYIFGFYCISFAGFWGYISLTGFMLLSTLQKHEADVSRQTEDVEDFEKEGYF
jgi:hypothetical protein